MTVGLEVSYISGRVHGTPWGTSHNEGTVEFPPSPWRILRALVSTWFERVPELPEQTVKSMLAALATVAPTYSVPPFREAHKRHYLPESAHLGGVKTATAKVLDAFAAVSPTTPLLIEWAIELSADEQEAFARLADQLPYIGRAESVVSARIIDEETIRNGDVRLVTEGPATDPTIESIRLLAPQVPLDFDALLRVPWKVRQQGYVHPQGATHRTYAPDAPLEWRSSPYAPTAGHPARLFVWSMRGKGKIPVAAAVAYCETLRAAIGKPLKDAGVFDWRVDGKVDGTHSERHHQHAHFLPIAKDGFLTGLLIWIPAGIDGPAKRFVEAPRRLRNANRDGLADFRPVQLFLQHVGDVDAPIVDELSAFDTASDWQTLTPYAPPRHLRSDNRMMRSLHEQIARDLEEIGHPAPTVTELVSYTPHSLDFRRHRTKERLREARQAFHIRLHFAEPVTGPISIGALSHFGLGHFLPISLLPTPEVLGSYQRPAATIDSA